MTTFNVKVFEVSSALGAKPTQKEGFTVDAEHVDEARKAVKARLAGWGHSLRSLASTGQDGFVAYIHAKE